MPNVALDDVVVHKSSILAAIADKEVLALDEQSGNCFAMGGSGLMVWEETKDQISVRAICDRLLTRYDVSAETCTEQTRAYVDTLIEEGLLVLVSPAR